MVTFRETTSTDFAMKDVQLYKSSSGLYNASREFQTNENDAGGDVYYKAKVYIESDLTNFKYILGILGEGYGTDESGQRIDINFGIKFVYTNSL